MSATKQLADQLGAVRDEVLPRAPASSLPACRLVEGFQAVSEYLLQVADLAAVGEGDGDLLSSVPDVVEGYGEVADFLRLCRVAEAGRFAGPNLQVVEGFFQGLARRLHAKSDLLDPAGGVTDGGSSHPTRGPGGDEDALDVRLSGPEVELLGDLLLPVVGVRPFLIRSDAMKEQARLALGLLSRLGVSIEP